MIQSMKNASNKKLWIVLQVVIFFLFSCMKDAVAVYVNRGNDYAKKGQYDEAILNYNKALEINPRYALAYYNRGNAYDEKGQYDQAISDFTKALEINPRFGEAYIRRGGAYGKKGQYDQAISDFNKALEINSKC